MVFVKDLNMPEGPVLLPDKSFLVVEMKPGVGCVRHISPDGQTRNLVAEMGRPNGLAMDKYGIVWVAETRPPSLIRLTMNGKMEIFLTECNGEPFLFPNDLAFGPDGALYMTDSGVLVEECMIDGRVRSDYIKVKMDGRVYKINVKTKEIEKLESGLLFTNGIAFGPDNNLYFNETATGMVYRYQWKDGKIIGEREDFGNVVVPGGKEGLKGPDGMKFGVNGNLYVTVAGQGNVTVLDTNGKVTERISTAGSMPTNLVFGPHGEKKIYVTEDEFSTLEVFRVNTNGFPLFV